LYMTVKDAMTFNDAVLLRLLLTDRQIDEEEISIIGIESAIFNGYTEVVKIVLEDKRLPLPQFGMRLAVGYLDILALLLADGRIDPAINRNEAIDLAFKKGYIKAVEMLLKDERVVKSLSKIRYDRYLNAVNSLKR